MMLVFLNFVLDIINGVLTDSNIVAVSGVIVDAYDSCRSALASFMAIASLFVDRTTLTILIVNYSAICGILLGLGVIKFVLKTLDEIPLVP